MIEFSDIVFYLAGAFMVFSALLTVLSKNVLHSAIFLIASFLGTAVLYILLHAEFMAVAQIMVYVGGVVVFILFAILLTSQLGEESFSVKIPRKFIAAIISLSTLFLFAQTIFSLENMPLKEPENISLATYAMRLLSPAENGLLIPFELISILLLMSLVASIALAKHSNREDK